MKDPFRGSEGPRIHWRCQQNEGRCNSSLNSFTQRLLCRHNSGHHSSGSHTKVVSSELDGLPAITKHQFGAFLFESQRKIEYHGIIYIRYKYTINRFEPTRDSHLMYSTRDKQLLSIDKSLLSMRIGE